MNLKTTLFSLFVCILFGGTPFIVDAATYYVDATGGSDSNNGTTTSTPWKTLSKISGFTFTAGDTILLKRGETWSAASSTGSKITVGQSGSAGNFITYGAYDSGADPVINATGQTYGFDIQTKSYIRIENIKIQNASTAQVLILGSLSNIQMSSTTLSGGAYGVYSLSGTKSSISIESSSITNASTAGIQIESTISGITLDNLSVASSSIGVDLAGGTVDLNIASSSLSFNTSHGLRQQAAATLGSLSVTDSRFEDNGGSGILLQGSVSSVTIDGTYVYSNTSSGISISPGSGKTAQSVNITDTQTLDNGSTGLSFNGSGGGSSVTIQNHTSTGNTAAGGIVFGTGSWSTISIASSTVSNNTSDGINFNSASGKTISSITIIDVTTNNNLGSGIQFMGSGNGTNASISRVTSEGNNVDGLNVKGGWTNVNFSDCLVGSNGVDGSSGDGDGITYHDTSTGSITRCFISNNIKSAVAHVGASVVDMSYNIFRHDTNGTIGMAYIEGTGTYTFYNNVLYSDSQTGVGLHISTPTGPTVTIKNNIVYGFSEGIKKTAGTITEDYNLVFNAGTSGWSGLTQGTHSLSSDPQFTNAADEDYSLSESSPARDSGVDLGSSYQLGLTPSSTWTESINTINQNQRGSGWEIGAYIYPVPEAPTIGSASALSASSIRWNFTDNASDETGFRVYDSTGAIMASSASTNLSYITEIALSENTLYNDRYVTAYNSYGNSASSSAATGLYTLTDDPANLILTEDLESITLTVDTIPNSTSGQSGFHFSRTDATSGWIQANTWSDLGLECGTGYTYSVKYRNGDGIESDELSISGSTGRCSNGGNAGQFTRAGSDRYKEEHRGTAVISSSQGSTAPAKSTSDLLRLAHTVQQLLAIPSQDLEIIALKQKLVLILIHLLRQDL